jgi:hypothetical protein
LKLQSNIYQVHTKAKHRAPELFPSGERLRLPKRSAMNSKLPKWMVLPRVNPTLVRVLSSAMMMAFGEGTIKTFREKHTMTPVPSAPTIGVSPEGL